MTAQIGWWQKNMKDATSQMKTENSTPDIVLWLSRWFCTGTSLFRSDSPGIYRFRENSSVTSEKHGSRQEMAEMVFHRIILQVHCLGVSLRIHFRSAKALAQNNERK